MNSKLINPFLKLNSRSIYQGCFMNLSKNGLKHMGKNESIIANPVRQIKTKASLDKNGPLNWKRFLISTGLIGTVFAIGYYFKKEKEIRLERERRRSLGKASLGGAYELVGTDNKIKTNKDFLGNWCLIYFGFTHCPDVCPEEMEKMVEIVDNLAKDKSVPEIKPIFISVDPARDTPKMVKDYCEEFSNKIIGLTGNEEQIKKASKAFRIYYSAGPTSGNDEDYIVDHTIIMYLINPDGEFEDFYGQNKKASEVEAGIRITIAKYNMLKKKSWF